MKLKIEGQIGAPIESEEQKQIQLEILKYVASFCENNNLRYFLADGTLIGAVRHHGYIPWDDDIDIRMPRPDYERMCEIFNSQDNECIYRLIRPIDDEAQHYFVKIYDTRTIKVEPFLKYVKSYIGIDIDVFPIDGAPSNQDEYDKYQKTIRGYNKAYILKKKTLLRRIMTIGKDLAKKRFKAKFCPFTSCNTLAKTAENICKKYKYDESEYVCHLGIGDRFRFPRSCYDKFEMAQFEDSQFRIPCGYDTILTAHYGDYMTLPPVEKQITHHVNKVFWKNNEVDKND